MKVVIRKVTLCPAFCTAGTRTLSHFQRLLKPLLGDLPLTAHLCQMPFRAEHIRHQRALAGFFGSLIGLLQQRGGITLVDEIYLGLSHDNAFGQTATMAAHGAEVARMFGLGMPAMLGFVATTLFLEGLGRPQIGVAVITIGNLLNVPLNWLFIHGAVDWSPTGAAGTCNSSTTTAGVLPWAALGLSRADAVDAYGNYYTYVVSSQGKTMCQSIGSSAYTGVTAEATGALTAVTDLTLSAPTGTRKVAFAIVGHGANRRNAKSATTGTTSDLPRFMRMLISAGKHARVCRPRHRRG